MILVVIIAFLAGLLVGAGLAIVLYARTLETRAVTLARQWFEQAQSLDRPREIAPQDDDQ